MTVGRNNVLRDAQLAREGRVETRHAPFAEHTLRIPYQDYMALTRLYPDLLSKDEPTRQAAWDRLHKSPFVDAYRVRSRKAQLGHF